MKINKVKIQNFRCYKGINKFNINGKNIVIYGENGYGKSSFFDAMEWCITGDIERFSKSTSNLKKEIIINRHSENDEMCLVEIEFEELKITRSFKITSSPRETISIEDLSTNKIIQGKEAVNNYMLEKVAQQRIDSKMLLTTIKQTHLLSQDQITDFVLRDNPKERFKSLATIMGYRQLINMGNNLNKAKNKINRHISELSREILTLNEVIEKQNNQKINTNLEKINAFLSQYNLIDDLKSDRVRMKIKDLKEKQYEEKRILSNKIEGISTVDNSLHNKSYNEINSDIQCLNDSISLKDKDMIRVNMLLEKNNEKKQKCQTKILNIEKNNKILKDRIRLERKLNELNSEVMEMDVSEKDLVKEIDKNELEQKKLHFTKLHLDDYLKQRNIMESNKKSIFLNKLAFEKLERRIKRYSKYLLLFESLQDNESEATSLLDLNDSINNIYEYIQNKNDDVCPVCSSQVEDLSKEIWRNLESNISIIQSKSNKISKVNQIIKRIKFKLSDSKGEKEKIRYKQENLYMHLDLAQNKYKNIEENQLFDQEMFLMDYKELAQRIDAITTRVKNLNRMQTKLYEIMNIKNKLVDYPKIGKGNHQLKEEELLNRVNTLERRNENLRNIKINLENKISEENRIIQNKIAHLKSLSKVLLENDFDKLIYSELNRIKIKYDVALKEIDLIHEIEELYNNHLNNHNIEKSNQELKKKVLSLEKEIVRLQKESDVIESHNEKMYGGIGYRASHLLNKPNSGIQRYFRYLNPSPNINKITFESPSAEELEIVLDFNKDAYSKKMNVQHSLSSGQLYVLAISIFLAMNEKQSISKFGFIAIDDPIQNMDDVNQFSICDVLSTIQRQLIFSTHDLDFLKLFLKKNENKKENIQVFLLESNDNAVTNVKKISFID